MEEWKSVNVAEYSEFYEVSTFGNVRRKGGNKIRASAPNSRGYIAVDMSASGKRKTMVVHRLVALTFIENPHGRNQVDHIDRNKTNNNVSNLRWVTGAENQANRGIPNNNTSGELHIYVMYKVQVTRNGKITQKCFHTMDEAKAFRLQELGY